MPASAEDDDDLGQLGQIGSVLDTANNHPDPEIRAMAASAVERALDNAKARDQSC